MQNGARKIRCSCGRYYEVFLLYCGDQDVCRDCRRKRNRASKTEFPIKERHRIFGLTSLGAVRS